MKNLFIFLIITLISLYMVNPINKRKILIVSVIIPLCTLITIGFITFIFKNAYYSGVAVSESIIPMVISFLFLLVLLYRKLTNNNKVEIPVFLVILCVLALLYSIFNTSLDKQIQNLFNEEIINNLSYEKEKNIPSCLNNTSKVEPSEFFEIKELCFKDFKINFLFPKYWHEISFDYPVIFLVKPSYASISEFFEISHQSDYSYIDTSAYINDFKNNLNNISQNSNISKIEYCSIENNDVLIIETKLRFSNDEDLKYIHCVYLLDGGGFTINFSVNSNFYAKHKTEIDNCIRSIKYLKIDKNNNSVTSSLNLPIDLFMDIEQVKSNLGNIYQETDNELIYNSEGFILEFNEYNKVKSISLVSFKDGGEFKGDIFGIKLGSEINKCYCDWGLPKNVRPNIWMYTVYTWNIHGYEIDCYTLRKSKNYKFEKANNFVHKIIVK